MIALIATGWLLVGPRLTLISGYGSSVRVEDFILGAFFLWFVVARPRLPVTRPVLAIGAVGIFSTVINWVIGRVELISATLYAIRTVEYFAVFPILFVILRESDSRWRRYFEILLAAATCLHVFVAALQAVLGVEVGFSRFAYDRGAGLTSGPYELGALCAALTCFWLAHRRLALAVLALVGVFLSASRISLVAVAVGIVLTAFAYSRGSRPPNMEQPPVDRVGQPRNAARPLVLALVLSVAVVSAPMWVSAAFGHSTERAADTSLVDSWETAGAAAAGTPPFRDAEAYQFVAYDAFSQTLGVNDSAAEDVSNIVRFYRWHLLLQQLNWVDALVGLGPSFPGPSVDGAYLRILVETGVLGLATWTWFVVAVWRASPSWIHGVIMTMIIGSAFIDLPFAMRPVVLVWGMLAYSGDRHNGEVA